MFAPEHPVNLSECDDKQKEWLKEFNETIEEAIEAHKNAIKKLIEIKVKHS